MNEQPIIMRWDGEIFRPVTQYQARQADKLFVVGECYALVEHHERSDRSHAHFFAALHDMWMSLPEAVSPEFPTAEHLRKHALIRCGYADKRTIACASAAEARRVAAFIKPLDEYAIVSVDAATVTVWTAQSQSHRAMGKKAFQDSKDQVLGWVAHLIGVTPASEAQSAGNEHAGAEG